MIYTMMRPELLQDVIGVCFTIRGDVLVIEVMHKVWVTSYKHIKVQWMNNDDDVYCMYCILVCVLYTSVCIVY